MEIQNSKDWAKCYKACNFIEKGVCEYADERVYLSEETLMKSLPTIKGRPVIIDHRTGITPENMNDYAVGYVTGYDMQSACDCDFVIFDDEGKAVIAEGYSVSCAYKPKSFGPGGTWHNVPYDREITDLEYTHLALVQNPRYEDAKVYENAKDDDGKGRWITVKGTHVFVKDGQSVEDAMKDTFKSSPTEKKEKDGKTRWTKVGGKNIPVDKNLKDKIQIMKSIGGYKMSVDDIAQELHLSKRKTLEALDDLVQEGELQYDKSKDLYYKESQKDDDSLKGKYAKEDADFDMDQIKKDIKSAREKGHKSVEDVAEYLGLEEDEVYDISFEDLSGKYESEDAEFDVDQLKDDIETAKMLGYEEAEDISEFLGLDEDEVRETIGSSNEDDELVVVQKGDTSQLEQRLSDLKSRYNEVMKLYWEADEDDRDLHQYKADAIKDEIHHIEDRLAEKNKEKHNDKEEQMKVEEFFNKMGEMIEEKLNACKGKMNEGEDGEDDDKFEFDGETYSKKELVNAFKAKKNEKEDEEEKENEDESDEKSEDESKEKSDEESKEKQNSGDEFFNPMEKRMQQQVSADDKIEVYSQKKGLEKGKAIYGG